MAFVVVACVLAAKSAFARDRCTPIDADIYECTPPPEHDDLAVQSHLNESGSLEVRFAFVSFAPALADKKLTGSGTVAGSAPVAFSASGKDLGFVRPRSYGGEIDVAYLRRYVRIGGFFGFSSISPDAQPANTEAVRIADGGSMSMLHAGLDVALILPLDRARLGVGGAFGGYFLRVPLPGFDLTTCSRGHYCYQTATTTIGFAQPRVSLDVDLTPPDAAVAASVGGFVGVDVANDHSVAWGITLALHEPQGLLAP